ncbi:MAG TPA: hypothetical protein VGM98_05685 [Schlesneria sp.]|jgi:hypothetical protein
MNEPLIIESGLYNAAQLIKNLKISRTTLDQWRGEGLPSASPGTKAYFYRGRDVIEFMFANRTTTERLLASTPEEICVVIP